MVSDTYSGAPLEDVTDYAVCRRPHPGVRRGRRKHDRRRLRQRPLHGRVLLDRDTPCARQDEGLFVRLRHRHHGQLPDLRAGAEIRLRRLHAGAGARDAGPALRSETVRGGGPRADLRAPLQWPSGRVPGDVNDPVDLEKLRQMDGPRSELLGRGRRASAGGCEPKSPDRVLSSRGPGILADRDPQEATAEISAGKASAARGSLAGLLRLPARWTQ